MAKFVTLSFNKLSSSGIILRTLVAVVDASAASLSNDGSVSSVTNVFSSIVVELLMMPDMSEMSTTDDWSPMVVTSHAVMYNVSLVVVAAGRGVEQTVATNGGGGAGRFLRVVIGLGRALGLGEQFVTGLS